jgi:hypothetical protein
MMLSLIWMKNFMLSSEKSLKSNRKPSKPSNEIFTCAINAIDLSRKIKKKTIEVLDELGLFIDKKKDF